MIALKLHEGPHWFSIITEDRCEIGRVQWGKWLDKGEALSWANALLGAMRSDEKLRAIIQRGPA